MEIAILGLKHELIQARQQKRGLSSPHVSSSLLCSVSVSEKADVISQVSQTS